MRICNSIHAKFVLELTLHAHDLWISNLQSSTCILSKLSMLKIEYGGGGGGGYWEENENKNINYKKDH